MSMCLVAKAHSYDSIVNYPGTTTIVKLSACRLIGVCEEYQTEQHINRCEKHSIARDEY